MTAEEAFPHWYVPWKKRVCDEVSPSSHGTVLRSRRYPDFWEVTASGWTGRWRRLSSARSPTASWPDCAHRLVESMVPMPDGVVRELRQRGWMASPLMYVRHDGRAVLEDPHELVEVDYAAVRELRDIWHREDVGDHTETEAIPACRAQGGQCACSHGNYN